MNRLQYEQSPYLLQHADNPVDWHPWAAEAFRTAQQQDKPIFLSIGYATCHWCHVMEHESFEDPEVAALMNETFINIKVDREERPDIDGLYMTVAQMLTGRGGWPLTIIMGPDQRPFFAATYVPKHSSHGRLGMLELIPKIAEVWNTRREEVAGLSCTEVSPEAIRELAGLPLAGNVRELKNRIERAAYRCGSGAIQIADLDLNLEPGPALDQDDQTGGFHDRVRAFEYRLLSQAIERHGNLVEAAKALELGYDQIRRLAKKHDLSPGRG